MCWPILAQVEDLRMVPLLFSFRSIPEISPSALVLSVLLNRKDCSLCVHPRTHPPNLDDTSLPSSLQITSSLLPSSAWSPILLILSTCHSTYLSSLCPPESCRKASTISFTLHSKKRAQNQAVNNNE